MNKFRHVNSKKLVYFTKENVINLLLQTVKLFELITIISIEFFITLIVKPGLTVYLKIWSCEVNTWKINETLVRNRFLRSPVTFNANLVRDYFLRFKKKYHWRKKLFAHLLSIFIIKCIVIGLFIDLFSSFHILFSFSLKQLNSENFKF